jgi:hypothetical protein
VNAPEIQGRLGILTQVSANKHKLACAMALADGPVTQQIMAAAVGEKGADALADLRGRRLIEKTMQARKLVYVAAPHFAELGRALRTWLSEGMDNSPADSRCHTSGKVARALAHRKLSQFDRNHQVLSTIAETPGIAASGLMTKLKADKRTIKRALTTLESAGVIRFARDRGPSHRKYWHMTEMGT